MELALALYNLGHVARLREEPERAETYFEESHANFRELEDVMGQAGTLTGLMQIAVDRGELESALSTLNVAAKLYESIGYVAGLLDSLELYAALLDRLGEPYAAARLWGARHKLGGDVGRETDHPLDLAAHVDAVARVRTALGDEDFERAWELGASMTLDEAISFALERRSPVRQPTLSLPLGTETEREAREPPSAELM